MNIQIIKADITKLSCDAIVNAANSTLLGGGGVDGCIHRAAGPALLEACKKLGGCKVGEAKLTEGFLLPARYVIHTVGPMHSGAEGEAQLLANCYINSLELAKRRGLESIAFCAISTGVYGYPIEEATKIAVKTVKRWLEYNDEGNLRVVFCCYSDRDVDVYVNRALAERIAPREENLLIPSIAFKSDNPRVMGCRTMPLECVAQKLKVKLEEHIFKNMRSSHISEDMNDHWDLLYENNKLYMYRSWTGICIFVAEIGDDGVVKQLLINQDSREYGGQVEESVDIALKLIKGYFKYDREYWRS